jgi:hypothetical protein
VIFSFLSCPLLLHLSYSSITQNGSVLSTYILKMAETTELPKTYKAAVYDKPGSISTKVTELEMQEPGPGEVLIRL